MERRQTMNDDELVDLVFENKSIAHNLN